MGDKQDIEEDLAEAVAFAIAAAQDGGLSVAEAISAALSSVTDYGRLALGDDIVDQFSEMVLKRRGEPLPAEIVYEGI